MNAKILIHSNRAGKFTYNPLWIKILAFISLLVLQFPLKIYGITFEEFIDVNYLRCRLEYYNHKIEMSPLGEPQLLVEGMLTPFSQILETIALDSGGRLLHHQYLQQGISPGRADEILRPFATLPTKPPMYLFEWVQSQCHSWIRLTTPTGECYSFGFYAFCPIRGLYDVVLTLIPRRGRILSPDPMEFIFKPEETEILLQQPLTEATFEQVIGSAQELQHSEELLYQILGLFGGENCHSLAHQFIALASQCPSD